LGLSSHSLHRRSAQEPSSHRGTSAIEFPIAADDVPKLDAVLVTHSDNDDYSVRTCRDLARETGEYHSTQYWLR